LELNNQIKELTLQCAKSTEQNALSQSTIKKQASQIEELSNLRKTLEKSLKDVKLNADATFAEWKE